MKNIKISKDIMFKFALVTGVIFFLVFIFYNPFLNIKLNGFDKVVISIDADYLDEGAYASFFGSKLESLEIVSNVDNKKIGEYTVTYKIKKFFTTKTKERTVVVNDTKYPKIIFDDNLKVCPNNYKTGYKAFDNVDGDITDKVIISKEGDYLNYVVTDSSGNETRAKRKVIFEDSSKPKITLKGSKEYEILINSKYIDPGYVATDNCDGDLTGKVTISGEVNPAKLGAYTITYKVSDSNNNLASINRNIHVVNELSENYPLINGYGENIEGPTYIKGILIVNKIYTLPSDYNPGVNKDANAALQALQADAVINGYAMPLISGFRSYERQKSIYEKNVANKGYSNSDYASARPGHSEHQSGLAFDVGKIATSWGETPDGKWLASNAHKYGFIIRYPKNKTNITGYVYEPWHIRYLGIDIATEIYESNLTLEEYLGVKATYE